MLIVRSLLQMHKRREHFTKVSQPVSPVDGTMVFAKWSDIVSPH